MAWVGSESLSVFLAREAPHLREAKIRTWLGGEPSVSLLVAAVHLEWTVCRAVLFLSRRPNSEVRREMVQIYGLERYKDLWRKEVGEAPEGLGLPTVVADWKAVTDAFKARDRLVHGRDRYTRNMATPHVEALLRAAADVRGYCASRGIDLQARMPVRKKVRGK
jgi:hypothetical protein